jgi:hypothetical protein
MSFPASQTHDSDDSRGIAYFHRDDTPRAEFVDPGTALSRPALADAKRQLHIRVTDPTLIHAFHGVPSVFDVFEDRHDICPRISTTPFSRV